jgi:hypothetical protein
MCKLKTGCLNPEFRCAPSSPGMDVAMLRKQPDDVFHPLLREHSVELHVMTHLVA